MNDLISRQAAIDVFYELWGTSLTRTIDAIKHLPSAELHWTPCSEGLPKEEGFYLVTLGYKHGAETNIRYFKIENGKRYWSLWGNENITAWMPKPIPYQQKEVTE